MKNTLLSDFTVDKAAKTVYVTREFDAGLSLVWDAFTMNPSTASRRWLKWVSKKDLR